MINLATIFQLNLGVVEMEKTPEFSLAHKKKILLYQQSLVESFMWINSDKSL